MRNIEPGCLFFLPVFIQASFTVEWFFMGSSGRYGAVIICGSNKALLLSGFLWEVQEGMELSSSVEAINC